MSRNKVPFPHYNNHVSPLPSIFSGSDRTVTSLYLGEPLSRATPGGEGQVSYHPPSIDDLSSRYPAKIGTGLKRHVRPRVFSAPSFGERISTLEVEEGHSSRRFGACNSRCGTQDEDTRVPSSLWDSVFEALHAGSSLSMEQVPSVKSTRGLRRAESNMSFVSSITADGEGYDPDDPRITGMLKEHRMSPLPTHRNGETFILLLTEALMKFGAPSHRIESQLLSVAALLCIKLQVIHVPGITLLSFSKHLKESSAVNIQIVKSSTKIDLGRLYDVHSTYKRVVHYEQSAKDAYSELKSLLKRDPIFSVPAQILISIVSGLILSPMAYNGSVLDLLAAGCCCGVVSWLHLWAARRSQVFSNVVEISSAIFIAFFARGLSSIPQGIFCYSAIAFTGLVKLLPKYLIICGSLEMASKQFMSGSVKMVYAIIWTLFLGFAITLGSDFYYIVDPSALHRRLQATQYLSDAVRLHGAFFVHSSDITGSFQFTNMTTPAPSRVYSIRGCYRDPDWPWYLQSPPTWTLVFLVPLYGVFSALASFQPFWNREMFVMVLVSCCSYTANRASRIVVPTRNDVAGAIGAFVIGVAGHLYSRIFRGTAFIAMFNGIGFLVPSAIAATGGLAQNYRGQSGDHYTSGLELASRMIQVALGTTLGLYTSSLFFAQDNGSMFTTGVIDILGQPICLWALRRGCWNRRLFVRRPTLSRCLFLLLSSLDHQGKTSQRLCIGARYVSGDQSRADTLTGIIRNDDDTLLILVHLLLITIEQLSIGRTSHRAAGNPIPGVHQIIVHSTGISGLFSTVEAIQIYSRAESLGATSSAPSLISIGPYLVSYPSSPHSLFVDNNDDALGNTVIVIIARRTLTLGIRGQRLIAVKTANRHTYANILAQAWTLTSSFEPPTPRHHHMAENLLDGWLALAAETRRVDRISSILGLDSPALQSSPSSLGTSCGSSGLNTPSQNFFRFLPLINDISPELLKTSLVDSLPASLSRSRSSSYNRSVPPRQIPSLNAGRHTSRRKASFHAAHESMPSLSDLAAQRPSIHSHPYAFGSRNIEVPQRPSLQSTRHVSYTGWPVPRRAPLATLSTKVTSPTAVDLQPPEGTRRKLKTSGPMFISSEPPTYEMPPFASPPSHTQTTRGVAIIQSSSSRQPSSQASMLQTPSSEFDFDYAITDSISPMLSEPFHRLIVKDEEDTIDALNQTFPEFGEHRSRNQEDTPSAVEDEELRWWENDPVGSLTFDMDLPQPASKH